MDRRPAAPTAESGRVSPNPTEASERVYLQNEYDTGRREGGRAPG